MYIRVLKLYKYSTDTHGDTSTYDDINNGAVKAHKSAAQAPLFDLS